VFHCFSRWNKKLFEETMRFKLVRTGRSYSDASSNASVVAPDGTTQGQRTINVAPIENAVHPKKEPANAPIVVWKGTVNEYRSLLIVLEAELIAVKAQLSGNASIDWYAKNRILDLEIKIADVRKWLAEAVNRDGQG
jgi:hypothetical protein